MIDASEITLEQRERLTQLIESGYDDMEKTNCRTCDRTDCSERAKSERLPKGILGGKGLCPKLSEN